MVKWYSAIFCFIISVSSLYSMNLYNNKASDVINYGHLSSQLGRIYQVIDDTSDIDDIKLISNSIYDIRTNLDLKGKSIAIPENCILHFSGGSFSNGTIVGIYTHIDAPLYQIFKNIELKGSFSNKFYAEWFGANPLYDDNSFYINYAISQIHNLEHSGGVLVLTNAYKITDTIYLSSRVSLEGVQRGGVMNTAVPKNMRSGSGFIFSFDDPNKWVVDCKLYDKSGEICDVPYNQMFIDTNDVGWGNNRKDAVYIRDISIVIDENSPIEYAYGGMRLSQMYNSSVENVEICGVAFGLNLNGCWSCHMTNLHIYAWYCALYVGHYVTTLTIRDSLFDKFYYNTNYTFEGEVKWHDKMTLFPQYTELGSSAIIIEGADNDCTRVALDGVAIEYFDAVSCSSGNNKLIMDKVYLEGIKKIISWTYSGMVYARNCILPLLTETESYTWGTYSGIIDVEGFPISRCAPTDNHYAKYIVRAFDERVLYYDVIEVKDGKYVSLNYNQNKIFHRLDDTCIYIGGNAQGQYIHDISYNHQLLTGFSPSNYTHFSEVIKRGYNNITLISNGGYTDLSLGEQIIADRNFVFKRFNSDSPYYLAYSSPIRIQNCQFKFQGQTFSSKPITYIDGASCKSSCPDYVFEVYGRNVLEFDTYLHVIDEGVPLVHLSGDDPIDLTIYSDANYRTFNQFVDNPDCTTKYKVTIIYPDSRKLIYTNTSLPQKGLTIGDIFVDLAKTYCYNGTQWIEL